MTFCPQPWVTQMALICHIRLAAPSTRSVRLSIDPLHLYMFQSGSSFQGMVMVVQPRFWYS